MKFFTTAWYRVFQFFFYRAALLLRWRKPLLLQGAGCVRKLPDAICGAGVGSVLFVTDRRLLMLHLPDGLFAALDRAGVRFALFDGARANPTTDIVEAARNAYYEHGCRGFLAFGGGSAIDTAKAAAARVARPKRSVAQMGGFLKVRRETPPVFAVPTTAGTGSEVTIAAVVTDAATRHKYAINDPRLIPVCAVLDPELTAGLPPAVTADTGMDALTHAVEAYITRGVTKKCSALSEKAARLIFENLERAYRNGGVIEARQNMLLAAFYAGDSFTRAGLTYVHAVAHTLGGLYDQPHGRANAVLLPHVLEAYGSAVHRKLARLAAAAGLEVYGMNDAEAAGAFIAEIRRLNRSMGMPERFDCIEERDIPQMVRWALGEANPWYPVPKVFGEKELTAVIRGVMA